MGVIDLRWSLFVGIVVAWMAIFHHEVIYGGRGTPSNAVRPCEMDIRPSMVFNMCGSLYQIIFYLLRDEYGGLRVKS